MPSMSVISHAASPSHDYVVIMTSYGRLRSFHGYYRAKWVDNQTLQITETCPLHYTIEYIHR